MGRHDFGMRERGYYGLPILKRPFWKWEIALYFFSEGISAGSYILCAAADLAGREKFEDLIRTGGILRSAPCSPAPRY